MNGSESCHYYDRNGEPRHTVVGKNGVERNSNLGDARKHGWLPSVTTIMQAAAKPGLERWKATQLMMAALTLPRQDGEAEPTWIDRVITDSKEQAKQAAKRGEAIHAARSEERRVGKGV